MLNNRVPFFILFTVVAGIAGIGAQSNAMLDELLAEEQASLGKTAVLALSAAGLVPEDATEEQALATIQEKGWKITVTEAAAPVTLGTYSYILMQAFELQGGLFYRMFPGPRYATRELAFLKLIPSRPYPDRSMSGEEAVRILGSLLEWKEGRS